MSAVNFRFLLAYLLAVFSGSMAAEVVTQSLQSHFPLWDIGILSSGVGFVYKVLEEKFPRKTTQPDIKKISEEVESNKTETN